MLLAASGVALVVPTMTHATLSSVDASRAGIAAGVLHSARQLGGMPGVAIFGYLIRNTAPRAFMHGMHLAIGISVALLLSASALCRFCIRPDRPTADGYLDAAAAPLAVPASIAASERCRHGGSVRSEPFDSA